MLGKAFAGSNQLGFPVTLADGTVAYALASVLTDLNGNPLSVAASNLDTNGDPVPVWKAHTFSYDGSGNLQTDTVSDGSKTWVRTYMYANAAQVSDSGWVKQ